MLLEVICTQLMGQACSSWLTMMIPFLDECSRISIMYYEKCCQIPTATNMISGTKDTSVVYSELVLFWKRVCMYIV